MHGGVVFLNISPFHENPLCFRTSHEFSEDVLWLHGGVLAFRYDRRGLGRLSAMHGGIPGHFVRRPIIADRVAYVSKHIKLTGCLSPHLGTLYLCESPPSLQMLESNAHCFQRSIPMFRHRYWTHDLQFRLTSPSIR